MHDSNKIANEFLRLAKQNGRAFTPMQLLKLVYRYPAFDADASGRFAVAYGLQAQSG